MLCVGILREEGLLSDPHRFHLFLPVMTVNATLVTGTGPYPVSFEGFFKVMRRVQDRIQGFRIYSVGYRMIRYRRNESDS